MSPEFENYFSAFDEESKKRLTLVYNAIKEVMPMASEKISFKMPTFYKGKNIIHFAQMKKHIGIYPGGEAAGAFAEKLSPYKTSTGAIQFPNDKPLPLDLLKEIATWCLEHNGK